MTKELFFQGIHPANGAVVKAYDNNEIELNSNSLVGTGVIVKVDFDNTTINYTVLLRGDVDGDADILINDLVILKQNLLKMGIIDGVFEIAADVNRDFAVTIADILTVKKHLLEISTIVQ